jgi:tetratricopeptide (TPR) repeat protein
LDRALEFQLKALEIREKVLDKDHPDLAQSYNNVSTIYNAMGQLDRALPFAQKAVAIMQKIFPGGHPNLDLFKRNLALLLREIDENKQEQEN